MALLLQLNGDMPEHFPGHERRLYVFACRRKTCRRKDGSIRALRATKVDSSVAKKANTATSSQAPAPSAEKKEPPNRMIGESLFGAVPSSTSSSPNPFSTSASAQARRNPFSSTPAPPFTGAAAKSAEVAKNDSASDLPKTFASALSIDNQAPKTLGPVTPPEPWPADNDLPTAYPQLYLADADYETLDKDSVPAVPQAMMLDEEGAGGPSQREEKDAYESTIDKTFQKFADRIAQNPEQVIRYEFKGQPLLYSKTDAVGRLLAPGHSGQGSRITTVSEQSGKIPRCSNCGAGRVFEVQLMPHAIAELEADEMSLDGMDWGTIIVGVCEKDCVPRHVAASETAYVEEWAGVQWEEIGGRQK